MNTKFAKLLKVLKDYKDPRGRDDKPTVYLVSNSLFIKGSYVSQDDETITLSSFSCSGLNIEKPLGTIIISLNSLSAIGSTLSVENQEN